MENKTPEAPVIMACLNCGSPVVEQYCAHCGQNRTASSRLTFRGILHEWVQEAFDLDRGLLHTVVALTLRPGKMVRDYLSGRRRAYTRPIQFYLIMLALYYLAGEILHVNPFDLNMGAREQFNAGLRQGDAAAKAIDVYSLFNENAKVIFTLLVTTLAASLRIFYRRSGYNFVECLVFSFYLIGYTYLPSVLLMGIISLLGRQPFTIALFYLVFVLSVAYYIWAILQWTNHSGSRAIGKAFLAFAFAMLLYFIVSIALMIILAVVALTLSKKA